jgi:thioredoxin-like negative regulator of GroEL
MMIIHVYIHVSQVAAVNCEVEKELCAEHGVQSYPTIIAVVGGVITPFQVLLTTLLSTLLRTTVRHVITAAARRLSVLQ